VRSLAEHTAQHLFASLEAKLVVLEAFELKGGSRGMMLTSTGHAFSLNEDSKPELTLFEGADGVVHVGGSEGATAGGQGDLNLKHCVLAAGAEELVARFKEAEQRRTCLDTKRNKASSRSHAFYRFHLAQKNAKGGITGTGACIELVDLAGSESNKDSLFHDRLRVEDTARINNSLMALNDCIRKQTQGASYVPFRADKLTQLLRPCFVKKDAALEGVVTVLFLTCLSPLASDAHQSIRGLTYTQQLTGMKPKPAQAAARPRLRATPPPWEFGECSEDPKVPGPASDSKV